VTPPCCSVRCRVRTPPIRPAPHKAGLNAYLARLPGEFPVRSLADLIRFNEVHAAQELRLFDQELLRQSQAKGSLDAIVTLTSGPAWLIDAVNGDSDTGGCSSPAAIAGYPHITVPAGLYRGLPIGLSFFAAAFSEPTLIKLASGFEHTANGRATPRFLPVV